MNIEQMNTEQYAEHKRRAEVMRETADAVDRFENEIAATTVEEFDYENVAVLHDGWNLQYLAGNAEVNYKSHRSFSRNFAADHLPELIELALRDAQAAGKSINLR